MWIGLAAGLLATGLPVQKSERAPALIPAPVKIEARAGVLRLSPASRIVTDGTLRATGEYLARALRTATGYPFAIASGAPGSADVVLTTQGADASFGGEGYTLEVTPRGATIRAVAAAGAFYGAQSLLQLLPVEVFAARRTAGVAWEIDAVRIEDRPRFPWRGLMLDVGRHYASVPDIKRLIDAMALHKLNTFHWHLTEDQGWRIEIKKYPRLTEVGAWRDSTPPYGARNTEDGQRYGGFYTQAEVREIVRYASARHITVVPEIELPGHAAAAIASYPHLGNTDVPGYAPRVMTRWGVHPYTFAPKEETFRFLEDVLTEVAELFPSTYIHIGGDEAPKIQWRASAFAQEVMRREGLATEDELQAWFIRRVEGMLAAKGRRLIGWDEIQEGGLARTATLMVWRDAKWARHALSLGNNVVMATTSHTYFDYYQARREDELAKGPEFEAIGGFLPLEKVYAYDPAFVAETPAEVRQILGTQGQLWSEYFKDFRKAEYMAFPRVSALAEVAWTPTAAKDYADFLRRLGTHLKRLDALGIRYRPLDGS